LPQSQSHSQLPVFFDPAGTRALIVRAVNWATWSLVGVLLACLIATSISGPILPSLKLTGLPRALAPAAPSVSSDEPLLNRQRARQPVAPASAGAMRYAHFVTWDENGFASLKRNAHALDVLIAEWVEMAPGGEGVVADPEKEAFIVGWVHKNAPALKIYPLVSNYVSQTKVWDGAGAASMLAAKASRERFAAALENYAVQGGYSGVVLNLEQLPASAACDEPALVEEIAARFRPRDLRLVVAVGPSDTECEPGRLAAAADALLLMAYDEHQELAEPGPLAGQGWFEAVLARQLRRVDASKLIVGIGSYGYDWRSAGQGQEVSVQEAWELLEESGARLAFDHASLNPTFTYVEEVEGKRHDVWYLDAVTAYNHASVALNVRPAGLALWRLGTEDPAVWSFFARGRLPDAAALEATKSLNAGYDVLYHGKGEVLEIVGGLESGQRHIAFDVSLHLITDQRIAAFPKSTTVTRWGARDPKIVALTFDDGPNRTFTPQILDILAAKNVKATFFVVGSAGVTNGDLLRRMHHEGHDIGNHTFTHLNSSEVTDEHLAFELNATQRLLESTLGVRTRLFRPPFATDLEPTTVDGADAIRVAGALGYFTIGMNIDPKDYLRPFADQIVAATLNGARRGDGNVILLHDAGGNRSATVKALPRIIDGLHAEGFRFAPVHELLGISREEVMPKVGPGDALIVTLNQAGFGLISGMDSLMGLLFQAGIVLGTLRLLFVASFAVMHRRAERKRSGAQWLPKSFDVLIPAYNEERVICKSIRSLLASPLKQFAIYVVDDGSSDRTAAVVEREFAATARVYVIRKANAGKWSALNEGLRSIDADVIVTLDADTIFEPGALELLLRHFTDPHVAAVAGGATVGNRVNLITRFQALEYVINQNLDRRALELVNGITVVPGSISAWRRAALLEVGGFAADTLAEDADATIRLEIDEWKVLYEPRAIARTEAPETIRSFLKQRMRWMFGTLQVAYKHRAAIWRGRPLGVSAFGLPNIFVFQFLFILLAPLVDLVLLWSLIAAGYEYAMRPAEGIPSNLLVVAIFWLYFQGLEIATAVLAITLDNRRDVWRLLPLLLIQRFCYRQLLYVTALRVGLAALKGRMLAWGKLRRTGRVVLAQV
jgi:cellulose synthase/poly-beta-1,6-N-acetylglucosamine synthase-like glycosyltransferase/peptidoglycan/xylan/chitin deacetylase (PgdA/CDA1 family)/spore germination protein YaaH